MSESDKETEAQTQDDHPFETLTERFATGIPKVASTGAQATAVVTPDKKTLVQKSTIQSSTNVANTIDIYAMSNDTTSLKVPKWNGKRESYSRFNRKFKSVATLKGYGQALHYKPPDPNLPKKWEDPALITDSKEIDKKKAILANDMAMAAYVVAFDTDALFTIIVVMLLDQDDNRNAIQSTTMISKHLSSVQQRKNTIRAYEQYVLNAVRCNEAPHCLLQKPNLSLELKQRKTCYTKRKYSNHLD